MATQPGMVPLAIVDTETLSLDARRAGPWEIALIIGDPFADGSGYKYTEHTFYPKVDVGQADPDSLRISKFYERYPWPERTGDSLDNATIARSVAILTAGRTLVAACPSFDDKVLSHFLRAEGMVPAWHYHLRDVEALAAGYLAGRLSWAMAGSDETGRQSVLDLVRGDWNSNDLSRAVGVEPNDFARHEAMPDCHWALAIYETVLGLR